MKEVTDVGFAAWYYLYCREGILVWEAEMTSSFGRRDFITLLGSAAAAWPVAARAQRAERVQRIGILMNFPANDPEAPIRVAAFLQRLQELGWTDRRNVQIDYRLTDNDSVQRDAAELVARAPDILVVNGTSVLKAVQQATKIIPVVFVNVIDPVGQGFVQSLAHPGGNITGLSNIESEMGANWLKLLKEIAPHVTQVAVVRPTNPGGGAGIETAIQAAAPSLGVKIIPFTVRIAAEIEHAITTLGLRPSLLGPQSFQRRTLACSCCRVPSREFLANGSLNSPLMDSCQRSIPIVTT